MPILSLKIIHPRKIRRCNVCNEYIAPGGEVIRLYGMAEVGDKPYVVFVHRRCIVSLDAKEKLRQADEAAEHHMHTDAALAAIKAAFIANEPIPSNKPVRKPRR